MKKEKKKTFDKLHRKIEKLINKGDSNQALYEIMSLVKDVGIDLTIEQFTDLKSLHDEALRPQLGKKDPWFTFVIDSIDDEGGVVVHVQGKSVKDARDRLPGIVLTELGWADDEYGGVMAIFEGKLKDLS
jgi:hypothetical protein